MSDNEPQLAGGNVLWQFTMSLGGFVAGPNHEMDWMMTGISFRPGLGEEYVETTGTVLGGRNGRDAHRDPCRARRRLEVTDFRAHAPPRGRDAHRRRHVPEL